MSSFTTPANLELIGSNQWKLITPFEYHIGLLSSNDIIIVSAGFETDLTSIPRIFWAILPPQGEYAKAAIIHDYLYVNAIGSKRYADDVFYEAMGVLNVAKWRKEIIYYAVRLFGRGKYQ